MVPADLTSCRSTSSGRHPWLLDSDSGAAPASSSALAPVSPSVPASPSAWNRGAEHVTFGPVSSATIYEDELQTSVIGDFKHRPSLERPSLEREITWAHCGNGIGRGGTDLEEDVEAQVWEFLQSVCVPASVDRKEVLERVLSECRGTVGSDALEEATCPTPTSTRSKADECRNIIVELLACLGDPGVASAVISSLLQRLRQAGQDRDSNSSFDGTVGKMELESTTDTIELFLESRARRRITGAAMLGKKEAKARAALEFCIGLRVAHSPKGWNGSQLTSWEDVVTSFRRLDMQGCGAIERSLLRSAIIQIVPRFADADVECLLEGAGIASSQNVDYTKFVQWVFEGNSTPTPSTSTSTPSGAKRADGLQN